MDKGKIQEFQHRIVEYWKRSGRIHLPWRLTTDPWRILLAEVLLRKTTSQQAAEVYVQLSKFSPEELAALDEIQLQSILEPIGLYRVRSKQLRKIASEVASQGMERLSSDAFIRTLPGIGNYIANTVQCFAFNIPKPALDTNMIRVIGRVFGWKSAKTRARDDRAFWNFAESLVPNDKCKEFNWGVLDFGAAICTPRAPKCPECPLNNICLYYSEQTYVHS